jgi:hypothetical protein
VSFPFQLSYQERGLNEPIKGSTFVLSGGEKTYLSFCNSLVYLFLMLYMVINKKELIHSSRDPINCLLDMATTGEVILVPFTTLSSCAVDCSALYDANGACVLSVKPIACTPVYMSCFCYASEVELFSTGRWACATVCVLAAPQLTWPLSRHGFEAPALRTTR